MGTPTEDARKQVLPPKPSGVTKPAPRILPTLGKVKKVLKSCVQKGNFAPLPGILNLLRSGAVTGDTICFNLLSACALNSGNKDILAEIKEAKEKLLDDTSRDSEQVSTKERDPAPNPNEQLDQEGDDGQVEEREDEDMEEQPDDPIDWVAKLEAVVNQPAGVYETFVSSIRSRPKWVTEADNFSNMLRVRLQINLDVSQSTRRRFGDEVTGLGVWRYGPTDDTHEGSRVYNRAAKVAAKECFLALEKIGQEVTSKAAQNLDASLSEYFYAWQRADFSRACAKAYQRAKDLVISDVHAGLYGARVFMYGSGSTGLALGSSDVDIAVALPGKPGAIEASKNERQVRVKTEVLSLLRRCAVKAKMETVCLIDTAKIPVLRYWDPEAKVDVDITLSKDNPILLSRFMRRHMQSDVRMWELCMCVKYWAKKRNVSGVFPEGFINSIGWTIMVIFFLQHIASPRVGSLFRIKGKKSNHCTIVHVPWQSDCLQDTQSRQTSSALLTRFFQFYGHEFDFKEHAISLNCQTLCDAKEARINKNSPLFIEHPLVRGTNVVGHVTANSLERTLKEMRRGYFECLTAGDAEVLLKERLGDDSDRETFFID